ncbi:unnamed protein product [Rhizophagus irregularis]|uniref:Uncharacterized protein n=1 Tax=Rhizophagus irregularis TaxID=588596 RepID=A0A2N1NGB3_9GLOM|nr:hypothetical protein RhiirC2_710039 [Rhizophagus irregularis]CAB4383303.1 unnamed protein product [Rhizophagus irregularis]
MRHLKRLLFGIILLSSFDSAFADEYDPSQDIFDQLINVIAPLLIIFLFDTEEVKKLPEDKKKPEDNRESEARNSENLDVETAERPKSTLKSSSKRASEDNRAEEKENIGGTPINSRGDLGEKTEERPKSTLKQSPKRVFDDFLYILSSFVLPTIVFYINHEEFATPIWIPILSVAITGVIIISIVWIYMFPKSPKIPMVLADIFSLTHEICFIFYTRYNPVNNLNLKNGFSYLHVALLIFGTIILLYVYYKLIKEKAVPNDRFIIICNRLYLLTNPVIQMLNMALLSGNGYYLTKLILAINITFLSRIVDYAREKPDLNNHLDEQIGYLYGTVISAFGQNVGSWNFTF